MRSAVAGLTAALAAVVIGGCAGGPDTEGQTGARSVDPTQAPLLIAVANAPEQLDPLRARTRSERLLTRQIFEPLFDTLASRRDPINTRPGLVRDFRASSDGRRWFLNLRTGVRFQNGDRLNGAAVVVNLNRWRATREGRRALPGLLTADSPRTDLVRLSFSDPVEDLPALLSSGRLGLVAPSALGPGGELAPEDSTDELGPGSGAGSGPYELRELASSGAVLARNTAWWAIELGFAPDLNEIDLLFEPLEGERFIGLRDGTYRVADGLRADTAGLVDADPLLSLAPGGGGVRVGFELSVKGIDSSRSDQSLADVWVSTIGG